MYVERFRIPLTSVNTVVRLYAGTVWSDVKIVRSWFARSTASSSTTTTALCVMIAVDLL